MPRVLATVLTLILVAGCSDKSPEAPSNSAPTVTGTWSGDLTVEGVTARMSWTLTQIDMAVAGPVLVRLPSGTVLMNGFLTGTLMGTTLPYVIAVGPGGVPTRPTCVGQLSGTMTLTAGVTSTLAGPMAVTSSTCTPALTGATLTLVKQ
jgi:hypothetical protein